MSKVVRCPASCGELIQGWIGGSEKLISCPINWYSDVFIYEGNPNINERPNMRKALIKTLEYLKIEDYPQEKLQISLTSSIPIAKGMASSTADIAATIAATAVYFGHQLTEQEIAMLCVSIEPTDSTFFSQITLFDHLKGQYQQTIGNAPEIDILILEPENILTTANYRRKHNQSRLIASSHVLELAYKKVQQGCLNQSPELIGEASTLSAVENQKILPKPGINKLLQSLEKSDLYGINVAHSGTVVGILLNKEKYDPEKIQAQLTFCGLTTLYPNQYWSKLISGGISYLN